MLRAEDKYVWVTFAEDLNNPDKTIAKADCKTLFSDNITIEWDMLTRYRMITNHTIMIRGALYGTEIQGGSLFKKDVDKAKADKDIKDKLSEKNKCNTYDIESRRPMEVIKALGWEGYTP